MRSACLLLPGAFWIAACASAPAQPRPSLAPAHAAPQSSEALPAGPEELALHPTTDGRDLIETPEQTYARVYGSCDFRDPKLPSPLDAMQATTLILVDPHDPAALRSDEGWTARNPPSEWAKLVKRLKRRDDALLACTAGFPETTGPTNKGSVVGLRLVPQSGTGAQLSVEIDGAPDIEVVRCIAKRVSAMLSDVPIERVVRLGVFVPDAVYPPGDPTLDKSSIRRIIQRNIESVRQCYQAALDVWPEIRGTVTVRFAIDSNDGHVIDARVVEDRIGKPALACCVARNVYGWRFAGNGVKGVSVVTYPFILEKVQ